MKKLLSIILLLKMLLIMSLNVYAAPGDIAGQYYSTDIKTYLNGVEIDSINIGGQTLISAEDMHYYSFYVMWHPEERVLEIDEVDHAQNGTPPAVNKLQYTTGTPLGYYYDTDIITELDHKPITAYNIGGRTYIHAEAMRDFGYVVDWYEIDRILDITSRKRTGYVYDIKLSYAEDKGYLEDPNSEQSVGASFVKYTKDGLLGKNDANFFDLSMHSSGLGYTFNMQFYQNMALFNSTELMDKLYQLCYAGYNTNLSDKSEKYGLVNQVVDIKINGIKANKVSVTAGAGNGHRDFYFEVEDLPNFKKDEIEEITFTIGNPDGEEYMIEIPDYILNGEKTYGNELKKFPYDWVQTHYLTDYGYHVYYMKESEHLGVVKDRLYIVNTNTGESSEDILEQVRKLDGFNYDILSPFAFKIGDIKNNFFFSCSSPEKVQDFYVELDTGKVHLRK